MGKSYGNSRKWIKAAGRTAAFILILVITAMAACTAFAREEILFTSHSNYEAISPEETQRITWAAVSGADWFHYAVKDVTGGDSGTDQILNSWTDARRFSLSSSRLEGGHRYKIWVGAYADRDDQVSLAQGIIYLNCEAEKPTVYTDRTGTVTEDAVALMIRIEKNGGAAVTDCGVKWGYSSGSVSNKLSFGAKGSEKGMFQGMLTGLKGGATIYYRAYATNKAGTSTGEIRHVTLNEPPRKPVVVNGKVTDITAGSATVSFSITDMGTSTVDQCGIKIGTKDNMSRWIEIGSVGRTGTYSVKVTGLDYCTDYYFTAFAAGGAGTAYADGTARFRTASAVPSVISYSSGDISETSAKLTIEILKNGGAPVTDCGVMWGTDRTDQGNRLSFGKAGAEKGRFSGKLTKLTGGRTYYFRAYAANSNGTSYGSVVSFRTEEPPKASVITGKAGNITAREAKISLTISETGRAGAKDCGIRYGKSKDDLSGKASFGKPKKAGKYSVRLEKLSPVTTYYYRAYFKTEEGTVYGKICSFKTQSTVPSVASKETAKTGKKTASAVITIKANGGAAITDCGIVWGTDKNSLNKKLSLGKIKDKKDYTVKLSGLKPGKTYYWKAYAKNKNGTVYGKVMKFTTGK